MSAPKVKLIKYCSFFIPHLRNFSPPPLGNNPSSRVNRDFPGNRAPEKLIVFCAARVFIHTRPTSSRGPGNHPFIQHLVLPHCNRGCRPWFSGVGTDQVDIVPGPANLGFKTRRGMRLWHFHIGPSVSSGNVGYCLDDLWVGGETSISFFYILIIKLPNQFFARSQEFTSERRTVGLDSLLAFLWFVSFLRGLIRASHIQA